MITALYVVLAILACTALALGIHAARLGLRVNALMRSTDQKRSRIKQADVNNYEQLLLDLGNAKAENARELAKLFAEVERLTTSAAALSPVPPVVPPEATNPAPHANEPAQVIPLFGERNVA